MIGAKFTLTEIENGWVVEFFSVGGPIQNDHTEYFDSLDKVLLAIKEWVTMVAKGELG